MSHVINFFGDVVDRNYDVITIISKYFYCRVTNFADTTKIEACLLKQLLKTQKKLEELEIMDKNAIYTCIS